MDVAFGKFLGGIVFLGFLVVSIPLAWALLRASSRISSLHLRALLRSLVVSVLFVPVIALLAGASFLATAISSLVFCLCMYTFSIVFRKRNS